MLFLKKCYTNFIFYLRIPNCSLQYVYKKDTLQKTNIGYSGYIVSRCRKNIVFAGKFSYETSIVLKYITNIFNQMPMSQKPRELFLNSCKTFWVSVSDDNHLITVFSHPGIHFITRRILFCFSLFGTTIF